MSFEWFSSRGKQGIGRVRAFRHLPEAGPGPVVYVGVDVNVLSRHALGTTCFQGTGWATPMSAGSGNQARYAQDPASLGKTLVIDVALSSYQSLSAPVPPGASDDDVNAMSDASQGTGSWKTYPNTGLDHACPSPAATL